MIKPVVSEIASIHYLIATFSTPLSIIDSKSYALRSSVIIQLNSKQGGAELSAVIYWLETECL